MFTRSLRLKSALAAKNDALKVFQVAKSSLLTSIEKLRSAIDESNDVIAKKHAEIDAENLSVSETKAAITHAARTVTKIDEILK